jgi:hypothetical protein
MATAFAVLAAASLPARSLAATANENVSGTVSSFLALTASVGATFATNFSPGNTASTTGSLTATDTNPGWTLQVADTNSAGGNQGHMLAGASGCTGSDASLASPLSVAVTSPLGGVISTGAQALSGTSTTVASATAQLLAASLLTTSYSQVIPATEIMRSGCTYSLTATYTLQ